MDETPLPPIGLKVPLLFSYSDCVFGDGFLAEVRAEYGRVLCVHEPDGFWMYGLNPGGLAAYGEDPSAAHAAFRLMFSNILIDLASENRTFGEFQVAVRTFFDETNTGYESDWIDAVRAVRNNEVEVRGIQRVSASSPRSIRIEEVRRRYSVADNTAAFIPAIAA